VERYSFKKNMEIRPENLAIAKIQDIMMGMEIELLKTMVQAYIVDKPLALLT
jgi:hypothetical protein